MQQSPERDSSLSASHGVEANHASATSCACDLPGRAQPTPSFTVCSNCIRGPHLWCKRCAGDGSLPHAAVAEPAPHPTGRAAQSGPITQRVFAECASAFATPPAQSLSALPGSHGYYVPFAMIPPTVKRPWEAEPSYDDVHEGSQGSRKLQRRTWCVTPTVAEVNTAAHSWRPICISSQPEGKVLDDGRTVHVFGHGEQAIVTRVEKVPPLPLNPVGPGPGPGPRLLHPWLPSSSVIVLRQPDVGQLPAGAQISITRGVNESSGYVRALLSEAPSGERSEDIYEIVVSQNPRRPKQYPSVALQVRRKDFQVVLPSTRKTFQFSRSPRGRRSTGNTLYI